MISEKVFQKFQLADCERFSIQQTVSDLFFWIGQTLSDQLNKTYKNVSFVLDLFPKNPFRTSQLNEQTKVKDSDNYDLIRMIEDSEYEIPDINELPVSLVLRETTREK